MTTLTHMVIPVTKSFLPSSSAPYAASPSMDSNVDGHLSGIDSGIFIYAVLVIGVVVAVIYFVRVALAHRRLRQRSLKSDFEADPPMYCNHLNDLPVVDDESCHSSTSSPPSSGTVTHTAFPASALIRGESYYMITPRVRVHPSSPSHPYPSHSHSGSATASAGLSTDGNSIPPSSAPAPYTSTDQLVFTPAGVEPPGYNELSAREVLLSKSDSL